MPKNKQVSTHNKSQKMFTWETKHASLLGFNTTFLVTRKEDRHYLPLSINRSSVAWEIMAYHNFFLTYFKWKFQTTLIWKHVNGFSFIMNVDNTEIFHFKKGRKNHATIPMCLKGIKDYKTV